MVRRVSLTRTSAALLSALVLGGCSIGAQTVGIPGPGTLPSTDAGLAPHADGEVLVRVTATADKTAIAQAVGGTILSELPRIEVIRIRLSRGALVDAIRTLQQRPDVIYAEPNYLAFVPEDGRPTSTPQWALPAFIPPSAKLTPNDPAYPAKLWGLVKVNAASAWDVTTGGSNVMIAILDTGIDATHPDLSAKVRTDLGVNCTSGTCVAGGFSDGNGHGTHVAGTAAALGNDATGVLGMAFNTVTELVPVKVLNDAGSGPFTNIAAGVLYAAGLATAAEKVVINMSLGGFGYSQTLQNAVASANASGNVLVVVAMGNEYKGWQIVYPAGYPGAMSVGATQPDDTKVNFSNTGPHISVSAPGRDIYSSVPPAVLGNSYAYFSGTSMSTPHVAGLAALVWSAFPAFNSYQVRRKIEVTAEDLGGAGFDTAFGWGRIGSADAVTGGIPTPFYGCGSITVTDGTTVQAAADVIITAGSRQHTVKTNSSGLATFDFVQVGGPYTVTASKVISGTNWKGSGAIAITGAGAPSICDATTITIAP